MTRWILGTIRGMDTPMQWAGGMALGVWIGLMPINSLLPILCAVLLVLCGANLLTGAGGFLLAFSVKPLLAPWFEVFGYSLLTQPSLQTFWVTISEMPLGPWCRFENTLVTGSFVGGVLISIPVFLTGWIGARPFRKWLAQGLVQSSWTAWLVEDRRDLPKTGVANT